MFPRTCNSIIKHGTLSIKQITTKNRTGTILRLNKKNFEDEELPHDLFLTTIQQRN